MIGYQLSERSKSRMAGVHPDLVLVFTEALKVSLIDFGIPGDGGVRTAERQKELFRQDKSQCDGYERQSNHQVRPGEGYGRALDFYAYVNGAASWEKHHLAMVAGVIMATAKRMKQEGKISIDLRWGGTFGSKSFDGFDMPHMEIKR